MRGVVAAGSEATARAGVEILQQGGNAVDAAVASCFATSAGEPTLTSLAGAGVMIHRDGTTGEVTICDFFGDAPGLGGSAPRPDQLDFEGVEVDFGPAKQMFYVGRGAAAPPGVLPGLCTALQRWGTLPLEQVIAPACRMMREGVVIGPWQAYAVKLLEEILLRTEAGRRQFAPDGTLINAASRYRVPQLADTLEQMAAIGWQRFHAEVLNPIMLEEFGEPAGGVLTAEDLASFEVVFRKPLRFHYRGVEVFTNPPPAVGGSMIALMLALLDKVDLGAVIGAQGRGTAEHVRLLAHVMQMADRARRRTGSSKSSEAEIESSVQGWGPDQLLEQLRGPLFAVESPAGGSNNTTHVSVIDEAGNAAAATFSFGEGNGHIIGDTGIMMNNLMGEEDLHPDGFHKAPAGKRLATMMSPSVLVRPDGTLVAMGTGGANRIRTAIVQVISNLVDWGLDPQPATTAARCHFEEGVLNAEVYEMADHGQSLEQLAAPELIRFDEPNLFFGGVHLVRLAGDELTGGGDPRRGGAVRSCK